MYKKISRFSLTFSLLGLYPEPSAAAANLAVLQRLLPTVPRDLPVAAAAAPLLLLPAAAIRCGCNVRFNKKADDRIGQSMRQASTNTLSLYMRLGFFMSWQRLAGTALQRDRA